MMKPPTLIPTTAEQPLRTDKSLDELDFTIDGHKPCHPAHIVFALPGKGFAQVSEPAVAWMNLAPATV
jgi:hypothetical protein